MYVFGSFILKGKLKFSSLLQCPFSFHVEFRKKLLFISLGATSPGGIFFITAYFAVDVVGTAVDAVCSVLQPPSFATLAIIFKRRT